MKLALQNIYSMDEAPIVRMKQALPDPDEESDHNWEKCLADGSLFAWSKFTPAKLPIHPRLELTLKLKQNYHLNVQAGKSEIINHPLCPIFPDGLWTDVLLGCFIDLDKVYLGYYSLNTDYRSSQTIGEFNISFTNGSNSLKPSKMIKMNGDWGIAFRQAKRVIFFAYPHHS